MGEAGLEPVTSAPEAWCASNEPPYLTKLFFPVLQIVSNCMNTLGTVLQSQRHFLASEGTAIMIFFLIINFEFHLSCRRLRPKKFRPGSVALV